MDSRQFQRKDRICLVAGAQKRSEKDERNARPRGGEVRMPNIFGSEREITAASHAF